MINNFILPIENFLKLYPNLINLITDLLVAAGTIGAVITSLWVANNQHRPKLNNFLYNVEIFPNGNNEEILNVLTGLDVNKSYTVLNIKNIGLNPAYINTFSISMHFPLLKKGFLFYPIKPDLKDDFEIPPNKNETIFLSDKNQFISNIRKFLSVEEKNLILNWFKQILKFVSLKAGIFKISVHTNDGKRHIVKINQQLKDEIKNIK